MYITAIYKSCKLAFNKNISKIVYSLVNIFQFIKPYPIIMKTISKSSNSFTAREKYGTSPEERHKLR